VTGSGKKAVDQLMAERAGKELSEEEMAYAHKIDMNALPHIDVFFENGYTKEEMKLSNETKKILNDDNIAVTATAVRIPTIGGHSEAVNIEFESEYDLDDVRKMLASTEGVLVVDNPTKNEYPMCINAHGKDETLVGRIRRDETQEKTLNLWIVADNLRKGAATNAVQIAEYLVKNGVIKA
jgi:aspartate-semialdehyde dehydrogenase